tara:strand:+ start:2117 stop:2497 length:381 start_codon:yes stop_codon:yes gene_type:complete
MELNTGTRIVSIEGGIGVGKSTIIERLKTLFKDNPSVVVLSEPVEEWESRDFLGKMYRGELTAGEFQHMVLTSLAGDLLAALRSRPALIITERSPFGALRNTHLNNTFCHVRITLACNLTAVIRNV